MSPERTLFTFASERAMVEAGLDVLKSRLEPAPLGMPNSGCGGMVPGKGSVPEEGSWDLAVNVRIVDW